MGFIFQCQNRLTGIFYAAIKGNQEDVEKNTREEMKILAMVALMVVLWGCARSDNILPDLKLTTLEFYLHDNVSVPASAITVAGPNGTLTGFFFGTSNVVDDLLTEGPSPTSKALGRARGTFTVVSLQADTVFLSFTAFLDPDLYKGSFNILGAENIFLPQRNVTVVGGTGNFTLAQGIATISTYSFSGVDVILHFKVSVYHI